MESLTCEKSFWEINLRNKQMIENPGWAELEYRAGESCQTGRGGDPKIKAIYPEHGLTEGRLSRQQE